MSDEAPYANDDKPRIGIQPALRDASAIARRVEDDEAAADRVRDHIRREGLQRVELPVERGVTLQSGEFVVGIRRPTLSAPDDGVANGVPRRGTLYLTDRRLIFVNAGGTTTIALAEVLELSAVGERKLLIALPDGLGLTYELDQPRAFRVEVSEAMAASRPPVSQVSAGLPPPSR